MSGPSGDLLADFLKVNGELRRVNADEIAKQRWPDDAASHAYDAARVAAATRAKLIELGTSFIAESVSPVVVSFRPITATICPATANGRSSRLFACIW